MTLVRRPVFLVLYAAVFAVLASFYFLHYPIVGFLTWAGNIARVVFFLLFLAATGRSILRWKYFSRLWGPTEGCGVSALLLSIGLGALPVSLGLLALGVSGSFRPGLILFLTALWALWVWRDGLYWTLGLAGGCLEDRRTGPSSGWMGLAAGVAGLALLCAFAPPTYYDSLVYHLALPATYLQEGRVGFVPYNQYAHFPQNMEMLFAWFLASGSDVAAQVFNVFLAGLTGLGLWSLLRPSAKEIKFRWDLLLFLTAPCVVLLSSETYVETPMAFWTLLSVWCAARGVQDGRRAWFVLSGLLGGFLAGIKYTGILTPVLLSALLILWPRSRSWRARWVDAACVAGFSFLVFSPWMIKNYLFTGGNPVFPFLPSLFPAKNVYLFEESSKAYFQVLDEYKGTSALVIELFKMPFRLATDVSRFGGGFDVTGDLGWALPLLLLPLGFLLASSVPSSGFLLIYLLGHVVLWASLRPVLRFLFPVFPLLCALGGQGLAHVLSARGPWFRRGVGVVVAFFILSNAVLFYWVERVRDPFPVALGLQSREDYLSRKLNYYPWMRLMDQLPPQSRVLFVGDQRSYYCPRPHVAPMALLPPPLREWADTAPDAESLRKKLVSLGFTHLFFHRQEAERIKSYRVLDLTPHGQEVFDALLAGLPVVQNTPAAGLYVLSPS